MWQTFIAFDFETTGFSAMGAEIIEIGAVRFDAKGNVLGTFEQLIKPAFGIKPEAQAVNGISEAMVANCPSLDMVMPQFMMFLGAPEQNILIAHNAAKFDIKFLAMACARTGMPLPDHRIVDSIDLCIRCIPKPHNLPSVCRRLGITSGGHRALGDAMAVMHVVLRLGSKHPDIWQSLPVYYAEEFGIEPIDVPIELEEWEACCDPLQEIEFIYHVGSSPGEVRRVIPRGFFEYKDTEYMTGLCLRDHRLKTFDVLLMTDIRIPEDGLSDVMRAASEAFAQDAGLEGHIPEKPSGQPVTNVKVRIPMSTEEYSAIWTTIAVFVLVVALDGFKLLGLLTKEFGMTGFVVFFCGVGALWVFMFIIINPLNGIMDSFLGPHSR